VSDNESAREVPAIILFMGAERVLTVKDLDTVKPKELAEFDYTIVKNISSDDLDHQADTTYRTFDWVKNCLISCRLHPSDGSEEL
jgi:hypothetical protein